MRNVRTFIGNTGSRTCSVALLAALALLVSAPPAAGVIIGIDNFDYVDGPVDGLAGGSGFSNERTNEGAAPASAPSDWDNEFGTTTVSSGFLATEDDGATREYNGLVEGSATSANEREGAIRGSGIVYYGVTHTRNEGEFVGGANWSGLSSYDFGTEKLFWGVPGGQGAGPFFGINESGVGSTLSTIAALDNTQYTLVTALDFDNGELRMWVNPDGADFDDPGTSTSADVTRAYGFTNWSTAVRLSSGLDAASIWDDLIVATTFAEIVAEPAANIIFADDFSDPTGNSIPDKLPDVGQTWDQTAGTLQTVSGEAVDTAGAGRTLFGNFAQPLGIGQTLVLDFETIESAGVFHSVGFAGISLFTGGTEQIFIGDPSDVNEWALRGTAGATGDSGVTGEAQIGQFTYSAVTGDYELFLGGTSVLSGTATAGLAIDRLRIANGDGGDIGVTSLTVSVIPEPGTLLLAGIGLALLGRRRRRAGRRQGTDRANR